MRDTAQGSFRAHQHASRYDHGPTAGFDPGKAEGVGWGWWLFFAVALAALAFSIRVHHHVR